MLVIYLLYFKISILIYINININIMIIKIEIVKVGLFGGFEFVVVVVLFDEV